MDRSISTPRTPSPECSEANIIATATLRSGESIRGTGERERSRSSRGNLRRLVIYSTPLLHADGSEVLFSRHGLSSLQVERQEAGRNIV